MPLHLPDVPEKLLHLGAVSAISRIAPNQNSPRFKNGSKSTIGGYLDVLDAPQLLRHLAAVSASSWITPGYNSTRFKNGSESTLSCLDVLGVPQLLLHLATVSAVFWITPDHNRPRVKNGSKRTQRSLNALDCSCTWLLSPPHSGSPKVTTAPDFRMAAKARDVDWMR